MLLISYRVVVRCRRDRCAAAGGAGIAGTLLPGDLRRVAGRPQLGETPQRPKCGARGALPCARCLSCALHSKCSPEAGGGDLKSSSGVAFLLQKFFLKFGAICCFGRASGSPGCRAG